MQETKSKALQPGYNRHKLKLMVDEYEPRDWHFGKVKDFY